MTKPFRKLLERSSKFLRRMYRTTEMEGYHEWSHLKQVWRVEKEIIRGKTGEVECENHYYLTNLDWNRFKPEQILLVVRAHWGIEKRLQLDDGCDLG